MYLIVAGFYSLFAFCFRICLAFGTLAEILDFFFVFIGREQATTQHTQRCKALGNDS